MKTKRILKWILYAVLIIILAIATLPLWLPAGLVKNLIIEDLVSQLNRNVTIGSVSFGWFDDVEINNLQIERDKEFGEGPVINITRLQCPFSLGDILNNTFEWLTIADADIYAVRTMDGTLNLTEIPQQELQLKQLRLKDVRIHIIDLGKAQPKEFILSLDGVITPGRKNLGAKWRLTGKNPADGREILITHGLATDVGGNSSLQSGSVIIRGLEISETSLDRYINDILSEEITVSEKIGEIAGLVNMTANFNISNNGVVDFDVIFRLNDLNVRNDNDEILVRGANPGFEVDGGIDFITNKINLNNFKFLGMGLNFEGLFNIDPRPGSAQSLLLAISDGEFSLAELLKCVPSLLKYPAINKLGATVVNDEKIKFAIGLGAGDVQDSCTVRLDFSELPIAFEGLNKAADEPALINLNYKNDRKAGRLSLFLPQSQWGSANLQGRLLIDLERELPQLLDWDNYITAAEKIINERISQERLPQASCTWQIDDVAKLTASFGSTPSDIPVQLSGAASGSLDVSRLDGKDEIAFNVSLDRESQFKISDPQSSRIIFNKKPGRELSLKLKSRLDAPRRRLDDISLNINNETGAFELNRGRLKFGKGDIGAEPTVFAGQWSCDNIQEWIWQSEIITKILADNNLTLSGNNRGEFFCKIDPNNITAGKIEFHFNNTSVLMTVPSTANSKIKTLFFKPDGTSGRIDVAINGNLNTSIFDIGAIGKLAGADYSVAATVNLKDETILESLDFNIRDNNLAESAGLWPALFDAPGEIYIDGYKISNVAGKAELQGMVNKADWVCNFKLDADQSAFQINSLGDKKLIWAKRAGDSFNLGGKARAVYIENFLSFLMPVLNRDVNVLTVIFNDCNLNAAGAQFKLNGEIDVTDDFLVGAGESLEKVNMKLAGELNHQALSVANSELLKQFYQQQDIKGVTGYEAALNWNLLTKKIALTGGFDLTDTEIGLLFTTDGFKTPIRKPAARWNSV